MGIFPRSRLDEATDNLVLRWQAGELPTLALSGEQTAFHFVQPPPDGILLAGARCRWSPDGVEKNALALDWDGRELERWTLGDGIADLRTTPDGTI